MENRIDQLFKKKTKNIISIYYPAGFPELDNTIKVAESLESRGVDMVEIGIPFSDPMADGVVIQKASSRALDNGISLKRIFEQLTELRSSVNIAVVLMGYLNPIMRFGFEEFCKECVRTGVDGVIIPDLPFADYIKNYKPISDKYGVKMIMLITPETSAERIELIDKNSSGFIYMVSTAATTGAQKSYGAESVDYFKRVAAMNLQNPRLIGFGISNYATYSAATEHSNGAIIGSHYVKLLESEESIDLASDKLMEIFVENS
ncbi:MAG: tryptophan synthase subunit alpha [Rikenellaceae bacterium]